jgi:histidinol-phosphate aminotransferase
MSGKQSAFNLQTCARPNILALEPYRCAREYDLPPIFKFADSPLHSDYKDNGTNILLDANENAYGPSLDLHSLPATSKNSAESSIDLLGLHRYPDPHQYDLTE